MSQVHPDSALPSKTLAQHGVKFDGAKPRWSLLPAGTVGQVVNVLEFGAKKYAADNWQRVPDSRARYYDASQRHIDAWWNGELLDPETGLPHLAHAVCCLLFLMWFDANKKQADSLVHSDAKTTSRCAESHYKAVCSAQGHRWTYNPATGDHFCGVCTIDLPPPTK